MNNINIDWHSKESHIFTNPRTPGFEKNKLDNMIDEFKLQGHIFLSTSGSTAIESTKIKWVALKKTAFLISANSVNKHLNCSNNDIFLNTLPHFHVGGLALFARAKLCEAKVIDIYNDTYKWNAQQFVHHLTTNKVTISSLVPTQVFDIVQNKLHAPNSLRTIVVGGGFLDKELYMQAKNLNWPLLPSYGMTECCSQIATASLNFEWNYDYPELTVLPHVQASLSNEGYISIKSGSLLTGYIFQSKNKIEFLDPKVNASITTSDIGEFKNNKLLIHGRSDENIKINGENVSLIRLQSILQQVSPPNYDCAIISLPDPRKGQKIAVVFLDNQKESLNKIQSVVSAFNEMVFPFERITSIHFLEHIPRTELGKLKRNLIMEMV